MRRLRLDLRPAHRRPGSRAISAQGPRPDDPDAARAARAVPLRGRVPARHWRRGRDHRSGAAPHRRRSCRARGRVVGLPRCRAGGGAPRRAARQDRVRRGRLRAPGGRHRRRGHRDPRSGRVLLPGCRVARRAVGRAGSIGVRAGHAARPMVRPAGDRIREPVVPGAPPAIPGVRPPDGPGRRAPRRTRAARDGRATDVVLARRRLRPGRLRLRRDRRHAGAPAARARARVRRRPRIGAPRPPRRRSPGRRGAGRRRTAAPAPRPRASPARARR